LFQTKAEFPRVKILFIRLFFSNPKADQALRAVLLLIYLSLQKPFYLFMGFNSSFLLNLDLILL
jgi:hypothetical protein